MRAIRFSQFGDPATLQLQDIPTPIPNPGEVLIQITAASVNPSDAKNVRGFMHQTTLPRTPGRDFAGTVIQGPPDLLHAEVWGTGDLGFTRDGTHAEFLTLPAAGVVLRPPRLSAESAACCGVTFLTAAYALAEAALTPQSTVAVIGVFGGVGRAAAQIARQRGARVIGIARTDPPADLPAPFHDMSLLNSTKLDIPQTINQLTANRGVDIVFDTVGGPMLLEALKLLAKRGRIIEISAGRDPVVPLDIREFYHREARLLGIDTLSLDTPACAALLRPLIPAFESGALTPPPIAARYPLEHAAQAYAAVEHGGEGRHILVPALKP